MFANVLIANRGEIACRIVRTARRMGMRSIAMHTPADKGALFTRLADEVHEIGEGASGYLDGAAIVALAERVGAECLHPGYGFLSENAEFAEACARAGIVFVGPPPAAMRAMGLKNSAKALMQRAGVPVVPGYHGENQNPKFLREKAYEIGYPVLIKAIAGGGGRGMRRVDAHMEFEAALESASREAEAAFGDGRVLIEKYRRLAAPHRDAGVRRRPRKLRPSVRARLLAPAPPPEGGRGMPGPRPAGGDARRHGEGGDRSGAGGRLCRGGDGRVHRRRLARPRPERLLFPRDEYAPAGRASGHRGGDRARSRRMAVPRRRRRTPAPGAERDRLPRRGDRGARLCGGSRARFPALAGPHPRDEPQRRGRPRGRARRHRRRRRRQRDAVLRPDDRKTHRPRAPPGPRR